MFLVNLYRCLIVHKTAIRHTSKYSVSKWPIRLQFKGLQSVVSSFLQRLGNNKVSFLNVQTHRVQIPLAYVALKRFAKSAGTTMWYDPAATTEKCLMFLHNFMILENISRRAKAPKGNRWESRLPLPYSAWFILFFYSWFHKSLSELKKNVATLNCWIHEARKMWASSESQGLSKALETSPWKKQRNGEKHFCTWPHLVPVLAMQRQNAPHSKWSCVHLAPRSLTWMTASPGDTWQYLETILDLTIWRASRGGVETRDAPQHPTVHRMPTPGSHPAPDIITEVE